MEARDSTIWLVDDDEEDALVYGRLLEEAGLPHIEVRPPEPVVSGYAALAADPATGAFVIDHHLRDRAGAFSNGLDVAEYLRGVRPEMPIFLLTDVAAEADLEEHAGAVESVIPKELVHQHAAVYASRILRSMDRYHTAMTDRQRRIRELIDRKVSENFAERAETFGETEERELASLRAETERAFDLALTSQQVVRDEQLRREEQRLTELRTIAEGLAQLNATTRDSR